MRCLFLFAGSLAFLTASCASVRSDGHPNFRLIAGEGYAWTNDGPISTDEDTPLEAFRQAVEVELERRGLELTARERADVLVDLGIDVRLDLKENHPNFELYIEERFEHADLVLDLSKTIDPLVHWKSETGYRLRYTERLVGGAVGGNWHPANETRDWHVDDVVERLFASVPD